MSRGAAESGSIGCEEESVTKETAIKPFEARQVCMQWHAEQGNQLVTDRNQPNMPDADQEE